MSLDPSNPIPISRDNASNEINTDILSKTHQLYPSSTPDPIKSIKLAIGPYKAFLSERGWIFLGNDTNNFLEVSFGKIPWSDSDLGNASQTIRHRENLIKNMGARYLQFIIPEKMSVYKEFAPIILKEVELDINRPAKALERTVPQSVFYLADYLIDAKSYGQLYFRGDTHTNWLGSWFVYLFIARKLSFYGLTDDKEIIALRQMLPSIASYDGDLLSQLPPSMRKEFDDRLDFVTPRYGFDLSICLGIPDQIKRAHTVVAPDNYKRWFPSRETLVYEREDKTGLKAVIFRDSTFQFCHELLAQHFSRSVFIWHQGQVFKEVIEEEQPDVVLHVLAERFVTRYQTFPALTSVHPLNMDPF